MKTNELITYQTSDQEMKLDVIFDNETVWLSQAQMTELFQTTRNNITMHISNVFREGELDKNSVCKNFLHTASDAKTYVTKYYNLDVIISVGYRVKSKRGTEFRMWANKILKEYIIKGYTIQKPVTIDDLNQLRNELKNAVADLEQQISNSEAFTEQQIADIYTTLVEMFSRKQIEEQVRKPIGFLLPKQKT